MLIVLSCSDLGEPPLIELKYNDNISLDYDEVVKAYSELSDYYKNARLFEMGSSDIGKPIHLFMVSGDGDFDPQSIKRKGKTILLINNGIHAGEPAGIDASLKFVINLLSGGNSSDILDSVVIAVIPLYNIGGALNQSPYHRMNQIGPELKGGRRNALNIDLNRDFVKMDTRNARTFGRIFTFLDPDIFLDTHSTNGSDHQFTMTLISTMHQKFPPEVDHFFKEVMVRELYERMNNETEWGMVPYVQPVDRSDIRKGIAGFNDLPVYSTGYAALFNTFSFMTETLIYKPFADRVLATYDFIEFLAGFARDNNRTIREMRKIAIEQTIDRKEFILDWVPNRELYDKILFKGYETFQNESSFTGRTVTRYNYDLVWQDSVQFFDYFSPSLIVEAPKAYIIPQGWESVIERLLINGVEFEEFQKDTIMEVEITYIDSFIISPQPNQGRHLLTVTGKSTRTGKRQFYTGDKIVYLNQPANNYIVSMMEPDSPVSFLRWGFFTSSLEDGEGFWISAFEDEALRILQNNQEIERLYEDRMIHDERFRNDPSRQLRFIYDKISEEIVETRFNLYPVSRL